MTMIKTKEFKAAARFCATKKDGKPVLEYVQVIHSQRTLIATNAYIAIRVTDAPTEEGPTLINKKGEPDIKGLAYPKVTRIIESALDRHHHSEVHNIDVHDWLKAHDLMLPIANEHTTKKWDAGKTKEVKSPYVTLQTVNNELTLSTFVPSIGDGKYKLLETTTGDDIHISYNPHYMITALKAYKDLKIQNVSVSFQGKTNPIVLQGGNVVCIILPMKIGG
jgi:hypothetical protein